MRLLLIRHGETQANRDETLSSWAPGEPLTREGTRQAETLVAALAGRHIDKIFASTLLRAQQTAAPLARARRTTVQIVEGLQEVEAGELEGQPAYLEPIGQWALGDLGAAHPGGFDGHHFLERFDAAIHHIFEETGTTGTAAVVTHHVCIAVWASLRADNITPDFAQRNPLGNTAMVELEGDPIEGWRAATWGDHAIS